MLDGFTELYEYPNLKQIISELNFIDAKFQVEEHEIMENLRGDVRDILMLDCNFGLLYDEPVYLLNQLIQRSPALQTIISDFESVFESDVWLGYLAGRIVNNDVIAELKGDILNDPRKFKYNMLWRID